MSKTTPGPWKHDDIYGLIIAEDGTEIAACHSGIKANAALIAAAPEMLEALKEYEVLLKDVVGDYATEEGIKNVRAKIKAVSDLIAKAEGKTP